MLLEALDEALAARTAAGLQRRRRVVESACGPRVRVDGRDLIAFGSNDYLGLTNHPRIVAAMQEALATWGVGAGAAHLLTGHYRVHECLEMELAEWVGLPRALCFSTGYMANIGVIPALVGREDAVFLDRLDHACLYDGAALSRAAVERYSHGDVADLERRLAASKARRKLIATDAVFSMDGDLAPLPELLALAERFDAWLLVDDAHGFGVLGEGRGSLAHFGLQSPRIIYMGTLGKAAGVFGAFVAAAASVVETLLQNARSYVFTTASPPALAQALRASLAVLREEPARRLDLQARIAQLRTGLAGSGWKLLPSSTAIQPLLIGDNADALRLSDALWEAGFWVPAIRPPTVPPGTARLRISLSAAHRAEDVAALIACLRER